MVSMLYPHCCLFFIGEEALLMAPGVFALKGTIAYTPTFHEFVFLEDHYLVCKGSRVEGVYAELPARFYGIQVEDWSGHIIIPGMCDMHIHAPQYAFRGLGQNIEGGLWDTWFERYAFPDESRYADEEYARRAYSRLTADLKASTTTRFCMYSSLHRHGTEILMELLHQASRRYQQTILMITHNQNLISSVDHVFRVHDGVLSDLGGAYV